MILGHGGNKTQLARQLGCPVRDIVDMSSNLNPLGPPEIIKKILSDNFDEIRALPQPDARAMREGFAAFHGLDADRVIAGNGTTWFIYTLPAALKLKRALIVGPTYSDYKDACAMHGIPVAHFLTRPENEFYPDMVSLSGQIRQSDLVFVCNPNNPTGTLISRPDIEKLLKQHPDTCFVLDESYLPFVDGADSISMVGALGYPNLVVLSSMSKIFSIPGLRTGFLSAPRNICDKIMAYYQPWSVNALAQAVIVNIFNHPEQILGFYQKTQDFIRAEKALFFEKLAPLANIRCFETHTYFVLAQLLNGLDSKTVCEKIGQHKILIRDCENFTGLTNRFVRFSLKTRDQNLALAGHLESAVRHV